MKHRGLKTFREPMGLSPEALSRRNTYEVKNWCPDKPNLEFDPYSDEENPKSIRFKHIKKALCMLRKEIPNTPLMKTRNNKLDMKLFFKLENNNPTNSFLDRGALFALMRLTEEQRTRGVITASLGNFAISLAYYGQRMGIKVTVVLPEDIPEEEAFKCKRYKAEVFVRGRDLAESKWFACRTYRCGMTYINGWDHPDVVAGAGVIALEVLQALPEADAIVVPVGGGGLLAGVAVAAKHINKDILIYGVQPNHSCCFFKAMQNDLPYKTVPDKTVATELRVPTAGYNAFHTAKSLVDKMILVSDDDIMRAMLHLSEHEKLLVSGAGATALAGIIAMPNVVPELRNKTVICVITSSNNVHMLTYSRYLQRALCVEGRVIQFSQVPFLTSRSRHGQAIHAPVNFIVFTSKQLAYAVTMDINNSEINRQLRAKILNLVANAGCRVIDIHLKNHESLMLTNMIVMCETKKLEDACMLKRVLNALYPGKAVFVEEPFSPLPNCACCPPQKYYYI